MPNYDFLCKKCGKIEERFLRLSDFDNKPLCCGEMMHVKITPINVQQDIAPYKSMITGEMITSRGQHRNHLKAHKCIEVGNEKIEPKERSYGWSASERHELKKDLAQRLN